MKKCGKCKIEKELSEFYPRDNGTRYYSKCKACTKVDNAKRKLRPGFREKENARLKHLKETNPQWVAHRKAVKRAYALSLPLQRNMYYNAKRRAEDYGLEFTITPEDIIIPTHCPYLGVPIVRGTKGDYEYTPSLDRVDNSKGYTKDNVLVVSKKGNSMKNSASLEELKVFCTNILTMINNEDIVQPTTN